MRATLLLLLGLSAAPALAAGSGDRPGPFLGPLADATGIPSAYAELGPADLEPDTPRRFSLGPASPNPFRGSTRLTLTLDAPQRLNVAVFDALGRRVALLHDGPLAAGAYPLAFEAQALPPGLYVVRVTDGAGGTATRSVALVR